VRDHDHGLALAEGDRVADMAEMVGWMRIVLPDLAIDW